MNQMWTKPHFISHIGTFEVLLLEQAPFPALCIRLTDKRSLWCCGASTRHTGLEL